MCKCVCVRSEDNWEQSALSYNVVLESQLRSSPGNLNLNLLSHSTGPSSG